MAQTHPHLKSIASALTSYFYSHRIGLTLSALLLIAALALYFRLIGTVRGYFAFTFDQGKDFLALYDMAVNKQLRLIGPSTGIDGVFHGVWWYWFLVPIYIFAQGSPQVVLTIFAILTTSIILVAFWLGKMLWGRGLGLILAVLVGFSHYFVGLSAQLWHPNMIPILVLLFTIIFWKYMHTSKFTFLIGVLLGLIFEFQFAFGLLFIPAVLLSMLIFKLLPPPRSLLKGIIGFSIMCFPRFLFDLRHQFLQLHQFTNYLFHPVTPHANLPFITRFFDRIQTYFSLFKSTFALNSVPFMWMLLGVVILGLYLVLRTNQKPQLRLIIMWLLTVSGLLLIFASIYPDALWNYYLIGFSSLFLPLVGIAIYSLIKANPLIAGTIFIFYVGINIYIEVPEIGREWAGDAAVFRNQLEVVQTVYANAQKQAFNVQVYSPSVLDYTYHYLFLWYGKKYYEYLPNRDGIEKIVYFIIEPDPAHPKLKEAWLRDREGDGTITWQQTFRGEIEVEKRTRQ